MGRRSPRISSASLPKLPRAQERLLEQARVLAKKDKRRLAPGYLELFASSCRFSTAMNECNLRLLPPFEINGCCAYDLSLPCIQVLILVWLLTGRAWFVHLAPPCKDLSVAKSSNSVSDASRSFVTFSCLVMSVCLQYGIGSTLEITKDVPCGGIHLSRSMSTTVLFVALTWFIASMAVCTKSQQVSSLVLIDCCLYTASARIRPTPLC